MRCYICNYSNVENFSVDIKLKMYYDESADCWYCEDCSDMIHSTIDEYPELDEEDKKKNVKSDKK